MVLTVLISVFTVSVFVYAATTIGNNISTGAITMTGTITATSASTSDDFWLGNVTADDDDYLYMDASSSEYLMWDDVPGMFNFSDDVAITGNASTTGYLTIGELSGDDDDYLYMDATRSESIMWDNDPGKFAVSDDWDVTGVSSSTAGFRVNDAFVVDSSGNSTTTGRVSIGGGTAVRQLDFGTCDFANTAVTASTTEHVWCNNATGITSLDTNIFVTATSSFNVDYIIQAASSTAEADSKISLRVLNIGMGDNDTLGGATLRWQSVR